MNEIIVFESLRFCPTKAKSRLLQKNHSGGRFRKPSFLVPDHLLVESKMEKKNLRIRVDRALISVTKQSPET